MKIYEDDYIELMNDLTKVLNKHEKKAKSKQALVTIESYYYLLDFDKFRTLMNELENKYRKN